VIEAILKFAISQRIFVVLLVAATAAWGVRSFQFLPIDAVPDITNNQVQINTEAPALSPFEIEKTVSFPIETALSGIPGLEYTRSISRNGFSQVTAVIASLLPLVEAQYPAGALK
jgi:cobalt-zinc-cadmium resistance protein CzcA